MSPIRVAILSKEGKYAFFTVLDFAPRGALRVGNFLIEHVPCGVVDVKVCRILQACSKNCLVAIVMELLSVVRLANDESSLAAAGVTQELAQATGVGNSAALCLDRRGADAALVLGIAGQAFVRLIFGRRAFDSNDSLALFNVLQLKSVCQEGIQILVDMA